MAYQTINPYTGETLATFEDATDDEVRTAIAAAHHAFLRWREVSFAERGRVLQAAADLLRRDSDSYARLLTLEMGKLFAEAKAEVELSAKIFEYYVRNAAALLAPEKLPVLDPAEGDAILVHEPLGVLLAIEPWNFPYYQIARIVAPQLSAGNTVLLKHASNVPQSAAAFEGLMADAGLPKGAFKNLYATRSQIELIINDDRVHGVALTGSEAAGSVVAAQAGKALKKSTMELGGADAFVVLADADLEKTAKWAVFGRHWNGGQVCCSSKRLIVVDPIYDVFLERYRKGVAGLVAGDPFEPKTTLAPLSSDKAASDLTGERLPDVVLTIVGPDSATARQARIKFSDELMAFRNRPPADELERMEIDRLSRLVVGWNVKRDGKPIEFTFTNVVKLLRSAQFIREQVEQFSQNRGPYFLRLT